MRSRNHSPNGGSKSPTTIRSVAPSTHINSINNGLSYSESSNFTRKNPDHRRSTFRYFNPMADIEAADIVKPKPLSSFTNEFREDISESRKTPNISSQKNTPPTKSPVNEDPPYLDLEEPQSLLKLEAPPKTLRSSSVSFAVPYDKENVDDRSDFERGLEMGMVLGLRLEDDKRDELADRLERDFSAGNGRDFLLMAENGVKQHHALLKSDNFDYEEDPDSFIKKRRRDRFKAFMRHFVAYMFSHVGICFLVVGYTLMGAFTFQALEYPNEKMLHANVFNMRQKVAQNIWKITRTYSSQQKSNWTDSVDSELLAYQNRLIKLVQRNFNGTHVRSEDFRPKWSLNEAFLYSLTVITTIGYGNLTPKTLWGKIVTIIYAIFGIPILLLYLSNVGGFLAHLFKYFYVHSLYLCCNKKARKRKSYHSKRKKINNTNSYNEQYDVLMESGLVSNHRDATLFEASLVESEFEHRPIMLNFEDDVAKGSEAMMYNNSQKDKSKKQKSTKKSKKKLRENVSLEVANTSHEEGETLDKNVLRKNKRSVSMKTPKSTKETTKKSSKNKSKKIHKKNDDTKSSVEKSKSGPELYAPSIAEGLVAKAAGDVRLLVYTDPAYYLQSTRLRLINPDPSARSPSEENFKRKTLNRSKISFLTDETQSKEINNRAYEAVVSDDLQTKSRLVRSASQYNSKNRPLSRSKSLPSRSKHRLANSVKHKHESNGDLRDRNLSFSSSYSSITVPVWLTLLILFLYVIAGTILFSTWEDWDYIDGSYFCFITLSTIGFGDLVPGETVMGINNGDSKEKLAITSLYILIGMAIIAMCFNLMQEQVTKSFRNLGIRLGIVRDDRL